jgi:signal transduction histidine kinase
LGGPLEVLIPVRFRAAHRQHIARFAMAAAHTRRMGEGNLEIVGLRKSGDEFPAEAGVSKLEARDGRRLLTIILRDVSVQKLLELSLRREIRCRDELTRTIVHDLRNPLNSITLQSQLMVRHDGLPERRDNAALDRIRRSATQMSDLLDDLLDVSRIEAGRLCVHKAPLSMLELLTEAVESARPQASVSSIDLRLEAETALPKIAADRIRVLEVLNNLVGNALKFTPSGGTVTVRAAGRGDDVSVSVTDTGPGIPAAIVDHLFEPFWQADPTDRRGAGLGLTITKGIVEAHGGCIWVESAPGAGATFFFTLPAIAI